MSSSIKLAVLASGSGSNFQAILDAIAQKRLSASVELLICNNPQAFVIERARRAGVSVAVVDHREFSDKTAFDAAIAAWLHRSEADLVVLAGFMRLLGPAVIARYPQRIVNIHPSLLPEFPGLKSIARALEAGVSETGVTVHFVDQGVDTGPIIAQAKVTIGPGETLESLEAKVHAAEHRLYPEVLQCFAEDRIRLQGRRVEILPRLGTTG